jgi:hypothetical protein
MNTRILILGVSVLCNCFCSGKAQPSFGNSYLTPYEAQKTTRPCTGY